MLPYLARFLRRGRHAWAGLRHLALSQPADFATYGLTLAGQHGLGLWLGIPARDHALLWLATSLVLFAETVNTGIERTVDRVGPERHVLSGLAKDLAAGAVFLAIFMAFVCAVLILGSAYLARPS